MANDNRVVGLAGATGALGKEILEVLDRAPWRPGKVVPLAGASSTTPFIEYGGSQVAVDDLANLDLAELDLLICAVPAAVAGPLVHLAIEEDVPVVDCSTATRDDAEIPAVLPWVNPQVLVEPPRAVRIPSSPASLIASFLGPLARAGVEGGVDATVLVPASWWGKDGIEELSRQVTSLFNAATPPRKVFAGGLAFDLIPQVDALDPSGWSVSELAVAHEAAVVSGWTSEIRVTLIGVPVFSGISAQIRLQPGRHLPVELVNQILVDGGMKRPEGEGARSVPRPRRVEGQPFPQVDRIRVDGTGAVHFWVAADNLRMSAAVAVATAGALLRNLD